MDLFGQKADFSGKKRTNLGAFFSKRSSIRPRSDKADLLGSTAYYKKILLQACHRRNKAILRKIAEGKEKWMRMQSEQYGIKDYINVKNTYRTKFGQRILAFS